MEAACFFWPSSLPVTPRFPERFPHTSQGNPCSLTVPSRPQNTRARLKITQKELKDLQWEHEVLEQRFRKVRAGSGRPAPLAKPRPLCRGPGTGAQPRAFRALIQSCVTAAAPNKAPRAGVSHSQQTALAFVEQLCTLWWAAPRLPGTGRRQRSGGRAGGQTWGVPAPAGAHWGTSGRAAGPQDEPC